MRFLNCSSKSRTVLNGAANQFEQTERKRAIKEQNCSAGFRSGDDLHGNVLAQRQVTIDVDAKFAAYETSLLAIAVI